MSFVPDSVVVSNIVELDDFSRTKDGVKRSAQSGDINILQPNDSSKSRKGLSESQVSVEVGVAKTEQAPEHLEANPLLKGTSVTPQASDRDAQVTSSPDHKRQTDNDVCEKTNPFTVVDFSEPSLDSSTKDTKKSLDDDRGQSKIDLPLDAKAENSPGGSSPALPDVAFKVAQTRDSIDVRWDDRDETRDGDRRSTRSRHSVKEGVCCCYQAFNRAFLQCVEETPAMVSGLVLSLAFCVAIIVLIPATGRVRHAESVCVCV